MSERIVAKVGGTSNADGAAVRLSLEWAESANVTVTSAPGELPGDAPENGRITPMLESGHPAYMLTGEVPPTIVDMVMQRYADIINDLGSRAMPTGWLDKIPARIEQAVSYSLPSASMLGERLQAEIYVGRGFKLLDPGRAGHDLGTDPEAWRQWLSAVCRPGSRYIMPGNTTVLHGQPTTISSGGSDTTGGLVAYGIQADLNLNLTDGCARSTDPRLIAPERLRNIDHLLYELGRELGVNGSGLVNPAAMVPLMLANIPTRILSTFDKKAPFTTLDNSIERAQKWAGEVIALSLMKDVTILRIHEPGMQEAVGRLAVFESALSEKGIALIDSRGDGVDRQKYFVKTTVASEAHDLLQQLTRSRGNVEASENLSLITLVGYLLEENLYNGVKDKALSSQNVGKHWSSEGHDVSPGRHSLRLSVRPKYAIETLSNLHRAFIEQPPAA